MINRPHLSIITQNIERDREERERIITEHNLGDPDVPDIHNHYSDTIDAIIERGEESDFTRNDIFKMMTNFTEDEYHTILAEVSEALETSGRGRQPMYGTIDKLFACLNFLKTYDTNNRLAINLGMKKNPIKKFLFPSLQKIDAALDNNENFFKTYSKSEMNGQEGGTFENFVEALIAVDCCIQPREKPGSSYMNAKSYYTKKQGCYCTKMFTGHYANGFCGYFSPLYKGSVHDFTIFKDSRVPLSNMTIKIGDEIRIRDRGELFNTPVGMTNWAILADAGFTGANDLNGIRAIIPHKKRNGHLTRVERARNNRISPGRTLATECFYGRKKTLWKATRLKSLGSHDDSKVFLMNRVAIKLTNFHLLSHPLQNTDGRFYRALLSKWARDEAERRRKKVVQQQRYTYRLAQERQSHDSLQ